MTIIVLYHGNCPDGFVAALTVWLKHGNAATYFPCPQGKPPPDVTGKNVCILDMAYRKEVIFDMINKAKSLIIIDHHKSNQDDLAEVPDKYKRFDMKESGATLTWQYLNPDKPLPLLYKYIRSRDLWTDDVPNTAAFHLAFGLEVRDDNGYYSFERAAEYLDDNKVIELVSRGKLLIDYQESLIKKALSTVCFCPIKLPGKKELSIVAYINTTVLSSDIGHRCLLEFAFVDFCACFSIDTVRQETHFCLRSLDDREDVSVIAAYHGGGGGHRNASGCKRDGLQCRLNYEHLDPVPLWCLFKGKSYRTSTDKIREVSTEYFQLLLRKFPNKQLQIELINNTGVTAPSGGQLYWARN